MIEIDGVEVRVDALGDVDVDLPADGTALPPTLESEFVIEALSEVTERTANFASETYSGGAIAMK
jgi:hypothetical protein